VGGISQRPSPKDGPPKSRSSSYTSVSEEAMFDRLK
jgi:hypothetical protein